MAEKKGKLALIINTASYERVAFALSLAVAGGVLNKEVSVLFGHGGVMRLKKGFVDEIGDETDAWIKEQIKSGTQTDRLPQISELLEMLKQLKGKIYVCPTSMVLHNLSKDDLIEEADDVCSLVEFLNEHTKDGSEVFYV